MRTDVPNGAVLDPGDIDPDNALFNSLRQFYILYCLIVDAEGRHHASMYLAASAMDQDRADPTFEVIAGDTEA
jgi:hypothetical protein